MSACSAATARAERYSLTNPSPTLSDDDHGDDDRVGGVAGQPRDGGGAEQEDEQRVAHLGEQDAERGDLPLADGVGPDRGQAPGGLGVGQTVGVAAQAVEDLRRSAPALP